MSKCGCILFPACGHDPSPGGSKQTQPWWTQIDPSNIPEILEALDNLAAKNSLIEFVKQSWTTLEPATRFEPNWHHELVCNVLQGMFEDWQKCGDDPKYIQRCRNAIFSLPPGSLKSRIMSVCFNAWIWVHCPGFTVICLSVNEQAALRDARHTRDLVKSQWYQNAFRPDWKLKDDQDAISNFGNTMGGSRISRPQQSRIIGLRADLILVDDPNDPHEAESSKVRNEVNDLWTTNIANRVNDLRRSLRIGVQQRVHASDWTGYILAHDGVWSPEIVTNNGKPVSGPNGWLHVCLPAEYEPSRKCITPWGSDRRTKEGESIHKARFTKQVLAAERLRLRDKYAGQMQQRPTLAEGGLMKREWWGFCRFADEGSNGRPRPTGTDNPDNPKTPHIIKKALYQRGWDLDWTVISVDPANKRTEDGSNWGLVLMAGKDGRRFILDDRTCKGDYLDILLILRDMIKEWQPSALLIEDKAAGPTLITALKKAMFEGDLPTNVTIESLSPDAKGDKQDRLEAVKSYIANGQVYLLDGAAWAEDFVEEMSLFPNGTFSDRVDCLSQCLAHFMATETVLPGW